MSAAMLYTCQAGIRPSDDRTGTVLWVQSPRTGHRLELFLSPYFAAMLPPRFASRVTHANANGRQTSDFTAAELHAFKRVCDVIAEQERRHAGPGVPPRRKPGGGGFAGGRPY